MPTTVRAVALLVVVVVTAAVFVAGLLEVSTSETVTVRGGQRAQSLDAAIEDFDRGEIETVLPEDAIPAIFDPVLVAAAEAELEDDDLVIGVELGGEARAYPIRVLSAHEIVNDETRGKAFAVTW